jgi:hypothetical protein
MWGEIVRKLDGDDGIDARTDDEVDEFDSWEDGDDPADSDEVEELSRASC